jgi:ketosteroid isomerase-like protein
LWTASTEEIRGLDDEHVLVTGELNAVGRRSGVPVKQDFVVVMTVRDGKISRTESFASREDALKAVRPDR